MRSSVMLCLSQLSRKTAISHNTRHWTLSWSGLHKDYKSLLRVPKKSGSILWIPRIKRKKKKKKKVTPIVTVVFWAPTLSFEDTIKPGRFRLKIYLPICLWLGPPWFNFWFSFTLSHSRISHEYPPLFIIVMNFIFMFSLLCTDWVGSLYANLIFMFFLYKELHRDPGWNWLAVKCFKLPVVYSTDRSKAVVPVLVLLCCFVVYSTRRFV